MKIPNKSIT